MARVYTYIRGKVTLLWYKLRYSAIRGEDGDEEEGWKISQELLVLIIVASRPGSLDDPLLPLLGLSINSYPLMSLNNLSFENKREQFPASNFNKARGGDISRRKLAYRSCHVFVSRLNREWRKGWDRFNVCILAIFSATSEEALLKSSQSLSPVVSDLGRGKLAFESVNGSSGRGGIDFIYKLERQMALALGEGGKGATARSRCIVERIPRTNGPSVIKMSPLGNSTALPE